MKPRPFDYVRPDTVDEALAVLAEHGDDARVLAGGQSLMAMLNLRLVEPTVADRYHAHCGARRDPRARRQDRGRRRGHAEQAAGLARACRRSFRCSPPRCRSSAISRPATRARCAARSRMPIRARKFRCRSRCWEARWCCARARARACCRRAISSGHAGAPRATPDELITAVRFPVATASAAWRSARWRAGTAISPSSRSPPSVEGARQRPAWRRRHGRHARRCAASSRRRRRHPRRRSSARLGARRLRGHPRLGRACGAICCAGIGPVVIAEAHPMRRVNRDQRARISLTLNGRKVVGRGRAAHAAQRFPPPRARRDRHPCRLRARHLRLLHGADRRRGGALVPHAGGAGRGQRGDARWSRWPVPTASSTRCNRRSRTIMRCNAGSARPAS